jgi:predicted GNAT family acetyltransferase
VVSSRLAYGGQFLWETAGQSGEPVATAARTPVVGGMARVAPVYTPPEHRGKGYGGAVTVAVSRDALEAGAREVVLFTDLANPTSNALYQRLGYRPVSDRHLLLFTSA